MKKVSLNKVLSLNKETIVKLNDKQMKNVIGGQVVSYIKYNTCPYSNCEINTGAKCSPTKN